jgi:hypothetical protein
VAWTIPFQVEGVILMKTVVMFIFMCSFAWANVETDYLFVFYDMGESNALKPVLEEFDQTNKNYRIVALGTAEGVFKNHKNYINIYDRCGVTDYVDPKAWDRTESISKTNLDKLQKCISPKKVMTGMASMVQGQVAKLYKNDGAKVVAYYDSFHAPSWDGIFPPKVILEEFLHNITDYIVPSTDIRAGFVKLKDGLNISVFGQPSLESWNKLSAKLNLPDIKEKLDLKKQSNIIYVGGYGDGYEESFKLFVQAANQMPTRKFYVSLHPKVDGSTEKGVIDAEGAKNIVFLPKGMKTYEAAPVMDCVVCQRSTAGVLARFLGRPVVYLDSDPAKYKNFLIEKGLSPQYGTVDSYINGLDAAIAKHKAETRDIYDISGIPFNAAKKIASFFTII